MILLRAWRAQKLKSIMILPSQRFIEEPISYGLGPIPPSWGLIVKTTVTMRSNPLSLLIYVMSFTCDFGKNYGLMVPYGVI